MKDAPSKFYRNYRSFRNFVGNLPRVESLLDLWWYATSVTEGRELPSEFISGDPPLDAPLREILHPWELEVLVREVVLNASDFGTRTLRQWSELATAINHIRRLDGEAYECSPDPASDILLELHRIVHRQFPWQTMKGIAPIMRVLKVFGASGLEEVVLRELDMTVRQFLQLGFAVTGSFQKNWGMSLNQDYSILGISRRASAALLGRITIPFDELRAQTAASQSYDRDWLYVWNPLEATPLVQFDPNHPDRVICPIPRFLFRRLTTGIFYDLVRSAGFDNPYGNAFQNYIGDVLKSTCTLPKFRVLSEQAYHVGSKKMHGVDWILSDPTGHLFIESKTKRLTKQAKIQSDTTALSNDLDVMATAIVQHYRNILDALSSKTNWQRDGKPIYPLVLTLENWFLFTPRVDELLRDHIWRRLDEANIARDVLTKMPFTIASAEEFEVASQLIARKGIAPLMSSKTSDERGKWSLMPFLLTDYQDELAGVSWSLFEDEWSQLVPDPPSGIG